MFVQTKQSMVTLQHTPELPTSRKSENSLRSFSVSKSWRPLKLFTQGHPTQIFALMSLFLHSALYSCLIFWTLYIIWLFFSAVSSLNGIRSLFLPSTQWIKHVNMFFFWLDRRGKRRLFCFWYTLFFAGGLVLPLQEHLSLISCTCRLVSQRPDWLKGQRGNSMQSGMCCETVRCVITFCFYWP